MIATATDMFKPDFYLYKLLFCPSYHSSLVMILFDLLEPHASTNNGNPNVTQHPANILGKEHNFNFPGYLSMPW